MRGWIELCSDVDWIDYHGMWARKVPGSGGASSGAWYILKWTNLLDAGGEDFADTPYECEVKFLDLGEVPDKSVDSALRSCGYKMSEDRRTILMESGEPASDHCPSPVFSDGSVELAIVECCIQHGLGAPLESFTGNKWPARIRAEARRYAEQCMKDSDLLEERLDRPVNGIGSTAREYGIGDIDAALHRGPFGTCKNIMRKMHGLPPGGGNSL
jgi:hypothetical protein